MKLLFGLLLVTFVAGLAGCTTNTPAYSGKERYAQIHRNQLFESEQFNDDLDYYLVMRPSSQETIWNVYHR